MVMSQVRHFVRQPEGALRRYVREILWIRSERSRVQVLLPETTLTCVAAVRLALLHDETLPNAVVSDCRNERGGLGMRLVPRW